MSQIKQIIIAIILGISIGIVVPISFQFGHGIGKISNFYTNYASILSTNQ